MFIFFIVAYRQSVIYTYLVIQMYLETTLHRFNGISSLHEAISFNQYMNIKYKFLSLDLEESESYV